MALYGLNGAGKSWALRILQEGAEGLASRGSSDEFVQLLVEAPIGSWLHAWIVDHLEGVEGERPAWDYRQWPQGEPEDPAEVEDYRLLLQDQREADLRALRRAVARSFTEHSRAPDWLELDELLTDPSVEELASSRTFALVPVGHRRSEWDVWLCASASENAELSGARRQVRSGLAAIEELNAGTWDGAPEADDETADDAFSSALEGVEAQWRAIRRHRLFGWARRDDVDRFSEVFPGLASPFWDFFDDDLPIPVVRLGVLRDTKPMTVLDEIGVHEDMNALTTREFSRRFLEGDGFVDDSATVTGEMSSWVLRLSNDVNRVFRSLLLDAPELVATLHHPRRWPPLGAVAWSAGGVLVDELSEAESRWARFSIRWVLADSPDLVLLDEPEAALHRSAEAHLARGLTELGMATSRLVVATHSPSLLDDPATHVVEISRVSVPPERDGPGTPVWRGDGRGAAAAKPLGKVERADLERLGLHPSDLLRRTRVFVLVEGEHDATVIRQVCGRDLDEARAEIIVMRGSTKLPGTIESQVLFEFTNAHLVAVLDSLAADEVEDAWREAELLALRSGWEDAVAYLKARWQERELKATEYQHMREWLSRALKRGVASRMTPLGLAARDIIDYLPVDVLVPGATSWVDLRAEHTRVRADFGRNNPEKDFKTWLVKRHGADFSATSMSRAAGALGESHPIHEDLVRIGHRIREIGYANARVPRLKVPE